MSREKTSWELPQWAGTLRQLAEAVRLAEVEIQKERPFPAGYDPSDVRARNDEEREHNDEERKQVQAAEYARSFSVKIAERNGFQSNLDNVEELLARAPRTLPDIESISIEVGFSAPSVSIALSSDSFRGALSVEIQGMNRNWVAGLRTQLEDILKPQQRVHISRIGADPGWFFLPGVVGAMVVFTVFVGVLNGEQALPVAAACAAGWGFAWAALWWVSKNRLEVLASEGQPTHYERWRGRVLAAVAAVILGVVAAAIYAAAS